MKKNKKRPILTKLVGFPGTFDPMHLGQLDVLLEACREKWGFKIMIIPLTVFNNSEKQETHFTLEERIKMIEKIIEVKNLGEKVSVKTLPKNRGNLKFSIRDFLKKEGISIIIRGKRDDNREDELRKKDYIEKEFGVKVLFMKTLENKNISYISSSLIKEKMRKNEDIGSLVPKEILNMIFRK